MSIPPIPKSEREARARVDRKLKALRKRAHTLLIIEAVGMFEEGPFSTAIAPVA